MNVWKCYSPLALLAAALLVPAALGAQQIPPTPPTPPVPPAPPAWVAPPVISAGNGLNQELETFPSNEGWLGVVIREVSSTEAHRAKLPRLEGVYVDSVEPHSPAANAGLEPHDIIIEYNGHSVEGVLQFERLVRETPPGRLAAMRVVRDGRMRDLSARVSSRSRMLESRMEMLRDRMRNLRPLLLLRSQTTHPLLGVRVEDIDGQLGRYFHVPGDRGVLVVEVMPDSAAKKAGIKAGDVIYQVEGKAVRTTGDLEQALRQDCSANGVSLGIVRRGAVLQLRVPIHCSTRSSSADTVTVLK